MNGLPYGVSARSSLVSEVLFSVTCSEDSVPEEESVPEVESTVDAVVSSHAVSSSVVP